VQYCQQAQQQAADGGCSCWQQHMPGLPVVSQLLIANHSRAVVLAMTQSSTQCVDLHEVLLTGHFGMEQVGT
jgi:hypothetical protein